MSAFRRAAAGALMMALPVACFLNAHASPPPGVAAATYGTVEILRDTWGVPHIFSDTDEGAMYGLGAATAEDRAFQMHLSLRIVQGRLSEVVGTLRPTTGRESSVNGDIRMRTMGYYRAAQSVAARLDPSTSALLAAYCAGVNDYISSHRSRLLYLFDQLSFVPEPWTPADCIASWWHLGQFFAGDGLGELANLHQLGTQPQREDPIVDDAAAVIQQRDVDPGWIRAAAEFAGSVGSRRRREGSDAGFRFSHAWVVGGRRSTTGSAVLVSDPQTPVRNPSLFYEFHVSGRTFNVRGIGVAGSPALLIGFNESLAWGVTALASDQADLFLLTLDPRRPDQYLFDGQWRAMNVRRETVRVRGGSDQEITIRETHLGPVVTSLATDVRTGEEVALKRIPICETDVETIQSAFAIMRARDVAEFDAALQKWRFPSLNAVFGDRFGNIGYRAAAVFPMRSSLAPDGANAAHDGSASKFDWTGMIPHDLVPHVMNPARGFLHSANHRPIGAFYPLSTFAGTGSTGDTVRSFRLREMLQGAAVHSPEDVLAMHGDSVNAARRDVVRWGRLLRQRGAAGLSEEMIRALDHLEAWYAAGARSERSVRGTELADMIPLNFRISNTELAGVFGGGEPGLCYFLRSLQERFFFNPSAQLSSAETKFIQDSLVSAWRSALQSYGSDPTRWQAQAADALRRRKIGYFESLDGYPSLDAARDLPVPALDCVDGGTIHSQLNQSYTQWVPLHDVDGARTILPVGQSELPDSPFRQSCYELWQKGELHPSPLTRAAVEKIAVLRATLSPYRSQQDAH